MDAPSVITSGLMVVSILFPLLSFASLALRFWARKISRQPFYADDWWALAAWVTTLVLSAHIWAYVHIGVDTFKVDLQQGLQGSLKLLYFSTDIVQWPLTLVKISILLFYKRLFHTKKFRVAVNLAIVLVAAWGIIFFCLCITLSDPIESAWGYPGRLRYDATALGYAQVGSSIGLDLVVLCFPLPVISRLHMESKRKIAVGLIFWLGIFCVIAAAVRFYYLHESVQMVINSPGFSAVAVQWKNLIFMVLEPNCSVIAACLPCYGPLFRGGRKPESLIRSIRSVFSLRSRGSTAGSGRDGSNENRKGSDAEAPALKDSLDDSSVALHKPVGAWAYSSPQSRTTVNVEHFVQGDEERGTYRADGINVTRGVEVSRE